MNCIVLKWMSSGRWELAFSRFSLHPALIFSPSLPLSFTLACCFSSLSLHYWYRTHLWIFPVSSALMTSPLSLLSQPLSLVYLSASLFLPLQASLLMNWVCITTLLYSCFSLDCLHARINFPLNCSPILQMNCLDNSIFLLPIQESGGAGEDLADSWRRIPTGSLISGRKSLYVL